jgi:hypothetical protein
MYDYQSEYLASYTGLYDVAHPGNSAWKESIIQSASGYTKLPVPIKHDICRSLQQWNKHNRQSRILTKNDENEWAEMTDELSLQFTHSQLIREDNRLLDAVLLQLDYLKSDIKFGLFRETKMAFFHVASLLKSLETRLLRPAVLKKEKNHMLSKQHFRTHSYATLRSRQSVTPNRIRSGILPIPPAVEPFEGAWLKVGDIVEGRYKSHGEEWYKGVITNVQGFESTWTIRYVDGEVDERLCQRCVRPFKEYEIEEYVHYLQEDSGEEEFERWTPVIIRDKLDNNETFLFENLDTMQVFTGVVENKPTRLRRTRKSRFAADVEHERPYDTGEFVEMFDGSKKEWFLGVIVHKEVRGGIQYYGIQCYDDDEYYFLASGFLRGL